MVEDVRYATEIDTNSNSYVYQRCRRDRYSLRPAIIAYALLIAESQRLSRIDSAFRQSNIHMVKQELANSGGHAVWKPEDHPDWLLLEIENNLSIRPEQYDTAMQMMSPSSGSNAIVQLNMGQGKTSVITPMICVELANGNRLVRVVVPKALLLQSARLLQASLGGMIGRCVKHIPFSRKSPTTTPNTDAYLNVHKQVCASRGIMVTLPEHLLSFKLSGIQCLSNGRNAEATKMLEAQDWLDRRSRDIIDEADVILAIQTQLIYPSGAQSTVDGHPTRWKTAETLLLLVKSLLPQLRKDFPKGIELLERPGDGFPVVYIPRDEVKETLLRRATTAVLAGAGGILPIQECSPEDLKVLEAFLREPYLSREMVNKANKLFEDCQGIRQDLLLLRGLLVHRIMLLALNKRWNVTYGIHPGRDPIAVPFTSKGVPSEQAEFGHPDVAILLTSLAFYYGGLSLQQVQETLKQVLRSDDPSLEYSAILQHSSKTPVSLSTWSNINVDDSAQCQELWEHLRYNLALINLYMNTFVFPRYAKTFEKKLVSSGWDLPIYHTKEAEPMSRAEDTNHVTSSYIASTTGFSGTNDNRLLLPFTIKQDDLAQLRHTNAEVLTYLLQPRNRHCIPASDYGKRLSEKELLRRLKDNNIRILIDAGAQILELSNRDLVKVWLQVDYAAKAAVYFDKMGLAMLLYRDGKEAPLASTPFADNIADVLTYYDQSHCRGTDLQLPFHAVAGLTLGLGQTKDSAVQAAMRLRRLSTTQSVMFLAPPEVYQSIPDLRTKTFPNRKVSVDSFDVVVWLLENSCANVEQLYPLFIAQGTDFSRRQIATRNHSNATRDPQQRASHLAIVEQAEQYSLEQLYGAGGTAQDKALKPGAHVDIRSFLEKLDQMKSSMGGAGDALQALAFQEVEQEREVAIEVETVREVQKPDHAVAAPVLPLHTDVRYFAQTSTLTWPSSGYQNVRTVLSNTAVGRKYGVNPEVSSMSQLYITTDFSTTIVTPQTSPRDEYFRPVTFFIWSEKTRVAMVISPYEAEQLLPTIRDAHRPHTYLVAYVPPVTRFQLEYNRKPLYSVPALGTGWRMPEWLVRELGVFAGRLYFDDDEQNQVCQLFGLSAEQKSEVEEDVLEHEHTQDEHTGHISQGRKRVSPLQDQVPPLTSRPLMFMQEWLAVCRKGQDVSQTPMGYLCRGRKMEMDVAGLSDVVSDDPGEDEVYNGADAEKGFLSGLIERFKGISITKGV